MIKYVRLNINGKIAHIEIMRCNWRNTYSTNRYTINGLSCSGTRLAKVLQKDAELAPIDERKDGLLFMYGWRLQSKGVDRKTAGVALRHNTQPARQLGLL